MNFTGRFGRNILSNAGGNAFHAASQLGLLMVLFQWLPDADYAAYITATYLIGLLEMASDFGGRLWATRAFSVTTDPSLVMRRAFQTKLVYTLIFAGIAASLPFSTLSRSGFLLCLLVGATQPSTDPYLWLLRGRERLDVEAVVVLVSRILTALGILLAAALSLQLTTFLSIWLLCNACRGIYASRLSVVRESLENLGGVQNDLTVGSLRATVGAVFPVGAALVLTCLFQRFSFFLVETYGTVYDCKIYGTAFKLVNASGLLATGIFVSSYAPLSKAIASGDMDAIGYVIRRKLLLVTAVFVPVCVLGIVITSPVAGYVPLADFHEVANVVVLLMPALYLSCVNMGLKYTLNAYALNWQDVGVVCIGFVTFVLAGFAAAGYAWTTVAAVAWTAGEVAVLTARIALLRQSRQHAGIPTGIICGSAVGLILMALVNGIHP